jgi:hypothetical protein
MHPVNRLNMAAALIARETTLRNDVFRVFRMADI